MYMSKIKIFLKRLRVKELLPDTQKSRGSYQQTFTKWTLKDVLQKEAKWSKIAVSRDGRWGQGGKSEPNYEGPACQAK